MVASSDATKPERGTPGRQSVGRPAPSAAGAGDERPGGDHGGPGLEHEPLAVGTKVGRYEIVGLIGAGGMGTVYEAMDARLGRKVALKVLAPALKSKRKAAKRFCIEAQAAARLVHPNVVGIYDFDVDCEYPYMAMEHLQGETLAAAIARGPFAFERVADVMLAVCAGVFAAHQAGIVHRDLKPSNIFLCPDWKGNQTARVLDFGISKVGGISSSEVTQTGDIVGTSQYLSPEQASGTRQVTELSDQYSLGVVMYECVTQQTPQRGQAIYPLLRNIIEGRHSPVHALRPDAPSAFVAIIERAMQVRPRDRFGSVLGLARALFPFASSKCQRQFADFCGLAKSTADGEPRSGTPLVPAGQACPDTQRWPAPEPAAWQRRDTRTARRPTGKARGRGAAGQAGQGSRRPSSLRRTVLSVALGAVLALLTLLVIRLLTQG